MEISLEALHKITAHYHLRSREVGKLSIIYLVVRVLNKQYKYSTGLRVYPEQWDSKRQRAFVCSHFSEICNKHNTMTNNKLMVMWRRYEDWKLAIADNPTSFSLSNLINNNMKKQNKKNAVIQLIKLLNEREKIKESSRSTYMQEIKSFENFLEETRGSKVIEWSDLTLKLLGQYKKWLYKLKVTHKVTGETVYIEHNTAQSKFKHFCTLLTYAEQAEYIDLDAIKLKKLTGKREQRDQVQENQIFLTEEEICRIQSLPLQGIYDQARDLFLVQVESGQRYEDINGINLGIEDTDMCTIATQKTGTVVTFGMSPILKNLRKKYNGKLPRISKIKTNKVLKEIGRQAGITRKHTASEHRGGELYRYEDEAWKFIGTHTARRSFITNNVPKCDPQILQKVTGHKTVSAFSRYNRMSSKDACSIFMKTKEEHPQSKEVAINGMSRYIEEQKKVLTMLGADPCIVLETNDVDTLRRMLSSTEDELIKELGYENIKPLKDIFNEHLPLHERKQKVDLLRTQTLDTEGKQGISI